MIFILINLGDSGGGLYGYDSILNKYIVGGIVSNGKGCGYGVPRYKFYIIHVLLFFKFDF